MFRGVWVNGGQTELSAALRIREACGLYANADYPDESAVHALVYEDDMPCATGRLCAGQFGWHMDGIAVLPAYRRRGYGELVTRMLLYKARELYNEADIYVRAPREAVDFYVRFGFEAAVSGGAFADMRVNGRNVDLSGCCAEIKE